MRELSPQSEAAFQDIRRKLLAGRNNGWAEWRVARHPELNERTFWRLLKKACALPSVRDRDVRTAIAAVNELQRMAPTDAAVAPPPAPLRRADAEGPVEVIKILRGCLADTEALRAWSMGPALPDGSRPIRNPTFFAKTAEMRIEIIEALMKLSERALDLQRMKQLFDVIIAEIREESPELSIRILERLRGLDAARGFTTYNPG